MAEVAVDPVPVAHDVVEVDQGSRIIDNAAVAAASLNRPPIASARAQARAHPGKPGATLFGLSGFPSRRVSPEWAAWANGVAVRELDMRHVPGCGLFPSRRQHPAGARRRPAYGLDGAALLRGLATGYEIQVDLVKGICLHEHKIDHIAHLGPSAAAGIGAASACCGGDRLPGGAAGAACDDHDAPVAQGRDFELEGLCAGSFAGKMAVEAVDRAMRGEGAPSPAYEGEDGFIAWLLGGPEAEYRVPLPEKGEAKRAILDTYTKEHSAEYQSQALIDLARGAWGRRSAISRR